MIPQWRQCVYGAWQELSDVLQQWSGAVTCPACWRGGVADGPIALRGAGPVRAWSGLHGPCHYMPQAPPGKPSNEQRSNFQISESLVNS